MKKVLLFAAILMMINTVAFSGDITAKSNNGNNAIAAVKSAVAMVIGA